MTDKRGLSPILPILCPILCPYSSIFHNNHQKEMFIMFIKSIVIKKRIAGISRTL